MAKIVKTKAYKVVRVGSTHSSDKPSHFVSAYIGGLARGVFARSKLKKSKDDFCLDYRIGEVTKPKIRGTRIFVFENLGDAKEYRNSLVGTHGSAILLCEVTNCHRNGWLGNFWFNWLKPYPKTIKGLAAWFKHNQDKPDEWPSSATCTSCKPLEVVTK